MSALDNLDQPDPPNASKAKRLPPIGSTAARNEIIEECAKVIEGFAPNTSRFLSVFDIAAAIRALKDKP